MATGELTLGQLEQRAEIALAAGTAAELARAVAGLAPGPAATRGTPDGRGRRWLVSVMGGSTLAGRWRVAGRLRSVSVMGGSDIDLRDAELSGDEVEVLTFALMGGDTIYVPDSVALEVSGLALMGGNSVHGGGRPARPGAPRVRVRACSLMGGVDVYRVPADAAELSPREARRLAKGRR